MDSLCGALWCHSGTSSNDLLQVEYTRKTVTRLYHAIEHLQWSNVHLFLTKGYWKGHWFHDRQSPLQQAKTWVVRYDDPDTRSRVTWKQLPLHAAIIYKAPTVIVQKLLRLYPNAVRQSDGQGNLPVHLAFRHGSSDSVLALLLQQYPHAMNCPDAHGLLPTQVATDLPSPQPLRGALLQTAWQQHQDQRKDEQLRRAQSLILRANPTLEDASYLASPTFYSNGSPSPRSRTKADIFRQQHVAQLQIPQQQQQQQQQQQPSSTQEDEQQQKLDALTKQIEELQAMVQEKWSESAPAPTAPTPTKTAPTTATSSAPAPATEPTPETGFFQTIMNHLSPTNTQQQQQKQQQQKPVQHPSQKPVQHPSSQPPQQQKQQEQQQLVTQPSQPPPEPPVQEQPPLPPPQQQQQQQQQPPQQPPQQQATYLQPLPPPQQQPLQTAHTFGSTANNHPTTLLGATHPEANIEAVASFPITSQPQQQVRPQQQQVFFNESQQSQVHLDRPKEEMERKLHKMERAIKEMYVREKNAKREWAKQVEENKHWQEMAQKMKAEEEKNRILTELLQDISQKQELLKQEHHYKQRQVAQKRLKRRVVPNVYSACESSSSSASTTDHHVASKTSSKNRHDESSTVYVISEPPPSKSHYKSSSTSNNKSRKLASSSKAIEELAAVLRQTANTTPKQNNHHRQKQQDPRPDVSHSSSNEASQDQDGWGSARRLAQRLQHCHPDETEREGPPPRHRPMPVYASSRLHDRVPPPPNDCYDDYEFREEDGDNTFVREMKQVQRTEEKRRRQKKHPSSSRHRQYEHVPAPQPYLRSRTSSVVMSKNPYSQYNRAPSRVSTGRTTSLSTSSTSDDYIKYHPRHRHLTESELSFLKQKPQWE